MAPAAPSTPPRYRSRTRACRPGSHGGSRRRALAWETRFLARQDERFDLVDDLLDLEPGRVDLDRVRGRAHPVGVAPVAVAEEIRREGIGADVGALREAPARPDCRIRGQVHLHAGVRRDDRADVPALHHAVALLGELTLTGTHDFAHRLV